jgi:predicted ATPase/transcriptional regulator with XRE-family HTH domain
MSRMCVVPSFGELLRQRRLAAGLTQETLAERAGVSAKAISDLERAPDRTPRLDTVGLLADALNLDPAERAALLAAARPAAGGRPGPGPAAAARTGRAPALPRPLTPLIGRDSVAAAVVRLLGRGDTQLLILTGPGGVGKTRLAIEVAGRVAGDFPDGVVFTDLTPLRDPGLVLSAVARQLGVDERDATPLASLLAMALRERRLLLVLDNFEHVLAARDGVVRLLEACPGVVVLVTSRVALRVRAGREYPVAPLALPGPGDPDAAESPAVELFADRADAAGVELAPDAATSAAVAEICRRLDGIPLAIELAAARLPLLPPGHLLTRLTRRLPVLVDGPYDLPDRQKTMRDAIAWSYELLGPAEQRLFRQLCVFTGGGTLDAVEAVCGADAVTGLAALVAGNLVRMPVAAAPASSPGSALGTAPGGPRVSLLETIREFGTEQLQACAEAEAARRAHAAWYLDLAEQAAPALAGPDVVSWLGRLDAEHDNLRAALRGTLEENDGAPGDGTGALRLAGALGRYWAHRGHLSEGRQWCAGALEMSAGSGAGTALVRIKCLVAAGRLAIGQAAYGEAERATAEAVALAGEYGGPAEQAAALTTQGLLARAQNRYADSAAAYEAALPLARAAGRRGEEATALLGLAYVAMFTGDAARASALTEQCLAAARASQDQFILAHALFFMSWGASHGGAYEAARALATEARDLFGALGEGGEHAEATFVLGTIAMYTDDHRGAVGLFEQSLAERRARGDEHTAARHLGGLGTALLNLGDRPRGRAVIEESLDVARAYGDQWSEAMSLVMLGHQRLADGEPARAQSELTAAAALFQATGNMVYMAWCLEGLAGVAAAEGSLSRAAEITGGRDALRSQTGVLLPPVYPAAWERMLQIVRDGLGEERFAAARGRLADRPPPEIIAAAVGPVPAGPADSAVPAGSGDGAPAGTASHEPGAVEPEKQTAPDISVPDAGVR